LADLDEHINYLDAVFLDASVGRGVPFTALFARNEAWKDLDIDITKAESVLRNHIVQEDLSCNDFFNAAKSRMAVESANWISWAMSESGLYHPLRYSGKGRYRSRRRRRLTFVFPISVVVVTTIANPSGRCWDCKWRLNNGSTYYSSAATRNDLVSTAGGKGTFLPTEEILS